MTSQQAAEAGRPIATASTEVSPDAGAIALRGGAIRVAGYVAGVLISLAAATILVRHLGIPGFGRYVTVMSLIALVGGVTEAGTYVYGIREFTARAASDRQMFMSNLLTMRLGLAAVGVALAVCFSLVAGYKSVLVLGALVAGAGLLAQVTGDVLSISLQAQLELGRLTAVDLARRLLALVLIGLLALLGAGLLPLLCGSSRGGGSCGRSRCLDRSIIDPDPPKLRSAGMAAPSTRELSVRDRHVDWRDLLLRDCRSDVVDRFCDADRVLRNIFSCHPGGARGPRSAPDRDLPTDVAGAHR